MLAAVDERHAGVASGVNNAIARTAQLVAVAVLPLAVGLGGAEYTDPHALTGAFHQAMVISAVTAVIGALIAAVFIRSDVLHQDAARAQPDADRPAREQQIRHHLHCSISGPPARSSTANHRP